MTVPYVPTLAVPMRVDAVRVTEPRRVASIAPSFDRVPFFDGRRDVNSGVPYLGDAVTPRPFQDLSFELGVGTHLHWAIPAALRQAFHDEHGTTFPAVPDRWLVRRYDHGQEAARWVVESDYLAPASDRITPNGVSYPLPVGLTGGQPFRYLGRKVGYAQWSPHDPSAEYLGRITAVGYGDPAFSAFYPSCHTVFGLHDDSEPTSVPHASYSVCGWYSNPEHDFVREQRRILAVDLGRPPTTAELVREFAEHLHLAVDLDDAGRFPDRTVVYGELQVSEVSDDGVPATFPAITIAPTGGEAMSALLARAIEGGAGPSDGSMGESAGLIEEQLDMIQLGSALDAQHADLAFQFDEASHRASFSPVADGPTWRVVPAPAPTGQPATIRGKDARPATGSALPDRVAGDLDELNRWQAERNSLSHRLDSIRDQLFADWQKYMIARYEADLDEVGAPDADRVLHFMERADLAEHDDARERLSRLDARIEESTARLAQVVAPHGHVLQSTAGPRYWAAAEPFVLLSGDGARPTSRLGRPAADDPLTCWTLLPHAGSSPVETADLAAEFVPRLGSADEWHPFLLEWQVELFPVSPEGDGGGGLGYGPGVLDAYDFGGRDVDLRPSDRTRVGQRADLYSGRSLLTGGTARHVTEALGTYVRQRLARGGFWGDDEPPPVQRTQPLAADPDQVTAWMEEQGLPADDPLRTALVAREILAATPALGQSMSGFTAGLLMHRGGYQLPIDDPLGFREYREATERVRSIVGHHARHSVEPLAAFRPLRAGDLSVVRLRLVDTFGRAVSYDRDVDGADVASSRLLPPAAGRRSHVHLPARLAQPARLDFRWLSATSTGTEVNDHPATSPICGWFTANHLDGTLMVFDDAGVAVGSILTGPDHLDPGRARWLPAPGEAGLVHPSLLPNAHLRAAVDRLQRLGPEGLATTVRTLDRTLDLIGPEGAAGHSDLALLMGQPFALVRAAIGVQLRGRPAVDQSWEALGQAMRGPRTGPRHDGGVEQLRVPVRLGELQRLDDGLLGYWVDREPGRERLRLAQLEGPEGERNEPREVRGRAGRGHHDTGLRLSAADGSVELSMLVDPRAPVHASCGLLPTVSLTIPADHHRAAMDSLEPSVLAAPVLSPAERVHVALPDEPGAHWSWTERRGATWTTVEGDDLVTTAQPTEVGTRLRLREGWLRLRRTGGDA